VTGESAIRKASRRLLPLLFCLYIVAYLDRVNVAFAKQSLSADLGFNDEVFGFGAGIFFVGYFLLEIPGALIAEHWSARLWMSRILFTWGALAMAEGFVRTASQFYVVRFLLGLAEAGFFPAALVYLSHWFPASARARALSGFILAVPLSFVIGAPLSAWCLSLDWLQWPGWRWLFVLQGAPAVLFGCLVPFLMPDKPRDAGWLRPSEREWLEGELERERKSKRKHSASRLLDGLRSSTVWLLAVTLFLIVVGNYGFVLWLPARLERASGTGTIFSTLLSGIPFVCALAGVWFMGRSSDARSERRWHTAAPLLLCAAVFPLTLLPNQPFGLYLLWSCIVGLGLWAWAPAFWSLPTLLMGESAAAVSLGLINCIGNLGGFFGPWLIGWLIGRSSGWAEGVAAISFAVAALMILVADLRRNVESDSQDIGRPRSSGTAGLDRAGTRS
jgi:ACS family tartrate transporter-like MFS transporter